MPRIDNLLINKLNHDLMSANGMNKTPAQSGRVAWAKIYFLALYRAVPPCTGHSVW